MRCFLLRQNLDVLAGVVGARERVPECGVEVREPTVMVNILGDAWKWREGRVTGEPEWSAIVSAPRTKLHLYGKAEPRPGRKMGHFTVRDAAIETALARARELKERL